MPDSFVDRMEAQRAILKAINQKNWPREELFSLSEQAIQRWIEKNSIGKEESIAVLARRAAESLLFLANISQEQISEEYEYHSCQIDVILNDIRSEINPQ